MKIAVVCLEGVSLWLAARIQDEGYEVLYYHAPPVAKPLQDAAHRTTGRGIVPIAHTWAQVLAWQPDLVFFDGSDYGDKADALRRNGIPVVGSCAFYDRLESERAFAMDLARECGMDVPEFYSFGSLDASMRWLKERPADERWYFKPDRDLGCNLTAGGDRTTLLARLWHIRDTIGDRVKHVLQRHVDGIALSTGAWWNGTQFLEPWEGTLELKEFGNDDTGPKTGCSMNLMWFYPTVPQIVKVCCFDKLAQRLRAEHTPPCIVDINAIVHDGTASFLEFTPRNGYDSEPTASRLLGGSYGQFLERLAAGTLPFAPFSIEEAAFSIRLSVPPYPFEPPHGAIDSKHDATGTPLLGLDGLWAASSLRRFIAYGVRKAPAGRDYEYELSDPSGIVGLSSAVGTDLEKMNQAAVGYAKSLGIADLGYRTDGAERIRKDLARVRTQGFSAPKI